jgi:hypothetical protein
MKARITRHFRLVKQNHHHTRYMKHSSGQYVCRTLTAIDIKLNALNPVMLFVPSLIPHPAVATTNSIFLTADHGFYIVGWKVSA